MLLLIDLDDTLIDRTDAFARWARNFALANGSSDLDAQWIVDSDRGGYCPRIELARMLKERFALPQSVDNVLHEAMAEHLRHVRVFDGVRELLADFRMRGWQIVIVTNGLTDRQITKFHQVGLEELVDGIVVSESSGSVKPDNKIFDDALALVTHSEVVWMVGDNPNADILGGQQMGFKTAWISHGKQWPNTISQPTISKKSTSEVLLEILSKEN